MNTRQIIAAALERSINTALVLDPATMPMMRRLHGKVIALAIESVDGELYLLPGQDRVQIEMESEKPADVVVTGTWLAFVGGAVASVRGTINPDGALEISGEPDTVELLRDLLGSLQPDFEEQLSSWIGDIPARQVGNGFRSFVDWLDHAGRSIALNTGEYLTEEQKLVATEPRIERFLVSVDRLRDDTDRLLQRVDRLERLSRGD